MLSQQYLNYAGMIAVACSKVGNTSKTAALQVALETLVNTAPRPG